MNGSSMTSEAKSIAKIQLPEQELECPIVIGTEDEKSIDIRALRAQSGYITLDDGYGNTGSCESKITYIDGEKGILRYRGYSIEDLAEHSVRRNRPAADLR
jgi:citrate synthase